MHAAYWHKSDFSVVMCLSRQVDSLVSRLRKDNVLLEANSVDSGDFRNYIWNDLAFIDNIAHSVIC